MGLYGNVLKAVDGSLFTFDKVYKINSKLLETLNFSSDEEKQNLISLLEKYDEDVRKLTMANIQTVVDALAQNDDVFVGRYIFIEGICQVYVKVYRDKQYSYVLVADCSSSNFFAEAMTDDWLEIELGGTDITDIRLIHEDAGPPKKVESNIYDFTDPEYYNPAEGGEGQILPGGIYQIAYDAKGHAMVKGGQTDYSIVYDDISEFVKAKPEVFSIDILYIAIFETKHSQVDDPVYSIACKGQDSDYLPYSTYMTIEEFNTNKQYHSENFKPFYSYDDKYFYFLKRITPNNSTSVNPYTRLMDQSSDYTLVLNGGGFLNKKI